MHYWALFSVFSPALVFWFVPVIFFLIIIIIYDDASVMSAYMILIFLKTNTKLILRTYVLPLKNVSGYVYPT